MLLSLWRRARKRFSDQLGGISEQDLTKKLSGTQNSVGFLIRHVAEVELMFAKNTLGEPIEVHPSTLIAQRDTGEWTKLDELLAYLDAVDEYGAPFEVWWATQPFGRVIAAADAFADRYQGTYVDIAGWAHHYLRLMGGRIETRRDLEAYVRTAVANGEVRVVDAAGGGIHVFWND